MIMNDVFTLSTIPNTERGRDKVRYGYKARENTSIVVYFVCNCASVW